jgi:hypothetical protein
MRNHQAADNTPSALHDGAFCVVKPALFEQYYVQSDESVATTAGVAYQRKDGLSAREAFRAMLTSVSLISTLLAREWSFGASISCTPAPERTPLAETISNGLATLLDEK